MAFKDNLELRQQLINESKIYGLNITDEQLDKLLLDLDLVMKKNEVINLTRITEEKESIKLHLIDSLLLCTSDINYKGKFLDIGTGAGFPGIPFAIYTGMDGILLDSTRKKIDCVNEFIEELGLSNQIHGEHSRVEEFALKNKNVFDVISARAVAQTNIIIEYASPLQKIGGILLVAKANISDDEFNKGLKAAQICGYQYVSRETFELPEDSGHREILVFKKVKKSKIKLPRKNGVAKQHPLGEE